MLNVNDEIIKSKKKKAKITSDAYPKSTLGESLRLTPYSEIHKVISTSNKELTRNDISFHSLSTSNYEELAQLHKEWFPINYTKEFFEKILKAKLHDLDILHSTPEDLKYRKELESRNLYKPEHEETVSIGSFATFDLKEYLIGCITCEIKTEEEFLFSTKVDIEYPSELDYFNYSTSNGKYTFAYIMTLGVIIEARRFKLATELLNRVEDIIKVKYHNCKGFYLHVIEYNSSAIEFYKKNNFELLRTIPNYYNIKDNVYSASIYWRGFKSEPSSKIKFLQNLILPIKLVLYLFSLCGCIICRKCKRKRKVIKLN